MQNAKAVGMSLGSHFTLSKKHSPNTNAEKEYMAKVPYA